MNAGGADAAGDSQAGARSRRARTELVGWVVAVVLTLGFLLWRVADNHPPGLRAQETSGDSAARVGQTYSNADPGRQQPRVATLRVPFGTEQISVSDVREPVYSVDGEAHVAPADGSLVQLDVVLDTSTATIPVGESRESLVAPSVALIADGRRYPLRQDGAYARADVIAVAGHPQHESVEITFAGVAQRVDLADGKRVVPAAAAALYRSIPSGTAACGNPRLTSSFATTPASYALRCQVAWRRVPYAPGRGWAKPDSSWLLASVVTRGPGAVVRNGSTLNVSRSDGRLTVTCADGSTADDLTEFPAERDRDANSLITCPADPGAQTVRLAESLDAYTRAGDVSVFSARWSVAL